MASSCRIRPSHMVANGGGTRRSRPAPHYYIAPCCGWPDWINRPHAHSPSPALDISTNTSVKLGNRVGSRSCPASKRTARTPAAATAAQARDGRPTERGQQGAQHRELHYLVRRPLRRLKIGRLQVVGEGKPGDLAPPAQDVLSKGKSKGNQFKYNRAATHAAAARRRQRPLG